MQRFALIALGVLVTSAAIAGPATASVNRQIALEASGTATVLGCLEGGAPPCAGVMRILYDGQASGNPFSSMKYRGPANLHGFIDVHSSSYDPGTGCYSTVIGRFDLLTLRGSKESLAFSEELPVGNSLCEYSNGHSYTTTFRVDTSQTKDHNFRDATGGGIMALSDSAVFGTPGVFSAQQSGTITTLR